MLHQSTIDAVEREMKMIEGSIIFVSIDPLDNEAYWRLLRDQWERGEDFVTVEHDMVPPDGALSSFEECPQPWCACPFAIGTGVHVMALGCTRFRKELMKEFPAALEEAGEICDDSNVLSKRHWKRLDSRLYRTLALRGYECHPHEVAEHLHEYVFQQFKVT